MSEFQFTFDSNMYRDVQQALEYAEQNAVHEDSEVAFNQARKSLHQQYTQQLDVD